MHGGPPACVKAVVISGSPRRDGLTQVPMRYVMEYAKSRGCDVSMINLSDGDVECFRGTDVEYNDATNRARELITGADLWLIGTPIYNSFFSAALKNLFEYVYKIGGGKAAGMVILASGQSGFTNVQTLLTQLISYFRVVANPKAVYMTVNDISGTEMAEPAKERLREMVDGSMALAERVRGLG